MVGKSILRFRIDGAFRQNSLLKTPGIPQLRHVTPKRILLILRVQRNLRRIEVNINGGRGWMHLLYIE